MQAAVQQIRDALEADILMFNVESAAEIHAINDVAASVGKKARIALHTAKPSSSGRPISRSTTSGRSRSVIAARTAAGLSSRVMKALSSR